MNPEDLQRDIEVILGSGINHTKRVMELLKEKGWSDDVIVPVVYQLLLRGQLNPNGNRVPYRTN